MKKMILVVLALLLVVPAIGNAGNVSSRYDVTFGGFVKFDFGWSSDSANADPSRAPRDSRRGAAIRDDEFSNTFMTGAQSRFNFLVKGPDLWGAKTNAFIEGDFRGTTTGNAHGGFQLRHAFMNMKWDSAELMIGQNWQQWGMPYYGAMIGANDFGAYLKGIRVPQIALRYFFTKEMSAMLGLTSATEWSGARGIRQVDSYSMSNWPGLQGEFAYVTDRFGKIGRNNLKLALGSYFGKEKAPYLDPARIGRYKDDETNAWLSAFRYSVPLVPEKKGDKTMALLLNGNFFYGQNVGGNNWLSSGPSFGSYFRIDAAGNRDLVAPTVFGLYGQLSWWVADNIHINGIYGYAKYNFSERARRALPATINMQQQFAVNALWDANQAVRFGMQWMRTFTSYNARDFSGIGGQATNRTGTMDQYRVAAWYFF